MVKKVAVLFSEKQNKGFDLMIPHENKRSTFKIPNKKTSEISSGSMKNLMKGFLNKKPFEFKSIDVCSFVVTNELIKNMIDFFITDTLIQSNLIYTSHMIGFRNKEVVNKTDLKDIKNEVNNFRELMNNSNRNLFSIDGKEWLNLFDFATLLIEKNKEIFYLVDGNYVK